MLKNYTALDLKNQMLIYILENYYRSQKMRSILNNHMAETLLLGGSLCTWVEKINRTMTWGDLEQKFDAQLKNIHTGLCWWYCKHSYMALWMSKINKRGACDIHLQWIYSFHWNG